MGSTGVVAKINGKTDFGGYLDIVLDFVFTADPLGFVVFDPAVNGLAGAALLRLLCQRIEFLAYAVMAERRKLDRREGPKIAVLHHGPRRGHRNHLVFIAFCLFPEMFPAIAWVFAVLTLYTAVSRIVLAWRTFG